MSKFILLMIGSPYSSFKTEIEEEIKNHSLLSLIKVGHNEKGAHSETQASGNSGKSKL